MIRNIADFLEKTAQKFPNKTAFVCGENKITFKEFHTLTNKVASKILSILNTANTTQKPVLIVLPKSIQTLVAFIATAKAGHFYTLLDPSIPKERILKITKILKPKLLITDENLDFLDIPTIFTKNFNYYKENKNALTLSKASHIDTNLLYVFFTSGSTGEPKGVSICHKSVIDYAFWLEETFKFSSTDSLANQAALYFDNSVLDILCALKCAASVHLLQNKDFTFPKQILQYLQNNKITTIFWVPSVLIYFANSSTLEKFPLKKLKRVLFCGEIMPNKQLNIWRKHLPHANFANLYGPTEITDVCSYFMVEREFRDDEILPIGKACENSQILLFDEKNKLITKANQKGEICVRGSCLSLGYYANEIKTNEAFIQNPLHKNFTDIIYRTGDIGAYNEFGEILCFGRKDFQVKIQGHRVELGEIESILISHKNVKNAVCIFKNGQIIAFYESIKELDLKEFISKYLPSYMIPRKFIRVENFALNANGKIDKKVLNEKI